MYKHLIIYTSVYLQIELQMKYQQIHKSYQTEIANYNVHDLCVGDLEVQWNLP